MWVAGLLVVLFPLADALPTTVLYYPIPVPFPRIPMLMTPSLYPKMGNRPFDKMIDKKESPSGYHTCHDHTAEWHEWESGSSGTIKVKRNGSRLAAAPWDLKLVFTHPVSLQVEGRTPLKISRNCFQVYNGVADVSSGSEFQVAPPSWGLGRSSAKKEDTVSFKVTFPNSSGPRLRRCF